MALKHILKVYPKPDEPTCYTGLFVKPLKERQWSNKPNKNKCGVSYTQFADSMDMDCGAGYSLFDYIHGKCWYYAEYFQHKNPDWQRVCMRRGTSWDGLIHCYCIKKDGNRTLFADARGITDDPETFFSDFTCGMDMYVKEETEKETSEYSMPVIKAYELIYKN